MIKDRSMDLYGFRDLWASREKPLGLYYICSKGDVFRQILFAD